MALPPWIPSPGPQGSAGSCVSRERSPVNGLGASPEIPRGLVAIPSTWRSLITPDRGGPHTPKPAQSTTGPPRAGVIIRRKVDGMATSPSQPNPPAKPRPSQRPAPPARSRRRRTPRGTRTNETRTTQSARARRQLPRVEAAPKATPTSLLIPLARAMQPPPDPGGVPPCQSTSRDRQPGLVDLACGQPHRLWTTSLRRGDRRVGCAGLGRWSGWVSWVEEVRPSELSWRDG
jgi:hypothetical protein